MKTKFVIILHCGHQHKNCSLGDLNSHLLDIHSFKSRSSRQFFCFSLHKDIRGITLEHACAMLGNFATCIIILCLNTRLKFFFFQVFHRKSGAVHTKIDLMVGLI